MLLDHSGRNVVEVDVPMRKVDKEVVHCNIRDATTSQSAGFTRFLVKYRNGWNGKLATKKTKFLPLRLTVRGAAGTGETFIINAIVSYMRRMFDDNDVFHVVSPTGMASFNVWGGLHIFGGLDWWNMKKGMSNI
jgi:hypothetical protein